MLTIARGSRSVAEEKEEEMRTASGATAASLEAVAELHERNATLEEF